MKLNKLCALLVASTLSTVALANQGGGTVTFFGDIIDAPCSVHPDSRDFRVDMGQVSKTHLEKDEGKSNARNFSIKLENCSTETFKTAQVSFSGTADANNPSLLGLVGSAGGAGIALQDGSGAAVVLGEATAATKLVDGNNTLNFAAYLQRSTGTSIVVPGQFETVSTFAMSYE